MAKKNKQDHSKKMVTKCQTRNKVYTLESVVKAPSLVASVSFQKLSIGSRLVDHVDAYEKSIEVQRKLRKTK